MIRDLRARWVSCGILLLTLGVGSVSATEPADDAAADKVDVSELSVVEMLARIAERGASPLNDEGRIADYRRTLAETRDPRQRVGLNFALGRELLSLGRTEEAIERFLEIRSIFESAGGQVNPKLQRELGEQLAVAYLRLGEQENCIERHTASSCILPLDPEAQHRLERGSRAAYQELAELLRSQTSLGYRWLLNIAAMTLGEYPDGVPEKWRIPPEAFDSEHPSPRLRNVAQPTGSDVFGTSGGVAMEDFDGDGRLDLMVSAWGNDEPLRLLRNKGDGTFEDRTEAAGLGGQLGGLNMVHTDYDNDGFADVLVLRGAWLGAEGLYPNSLLRNKGDGTFEDRTREAGVLSLLPTSSAAWADYDLDGHLDLFVGNESMPGVESPCQLYRNNGDGTFSEVAEAEGLGVEGFVKGVVWGDVDGDRWPDLYVSRFGDSNLLFRNLGSKRGDGGPRFVEIAEAAGVSGPEMSFPTWFWDYDNDGRLDLLVAPFSGFYNNSLSEIVAEVLGLPSMLGHGRLFRNVSGAGQIAFEDVTGEAAFDRALLAMGANFGDVDNDGYLDAYFGTGEPNLGTLVPNTLLRNDGGRRFQNVTSAAGVGHLQKGHGVAFGDLDNDGDEDIYAVIGGAYMGDGYWNVLFENPGNQNAWVVLKLEGTASNRAAIGARVRVVASSDDGERSIWRTVGTGGSFGSSSLQQEIGLGTARTIDRVEVTWPRAGGETEVFRGLEPGGFYLLREGSGRAERIERPRIELRHEGGSHAH